MTRKTIEDIATDLRLLDDQALHRLAARHPSFRKLIERELAARRHPEATGIPAQAEMAC